MKDFMLIFRQPSYDYSNTPKEEMQALGKKWADWAGGIAAQGKLSSNGSRLAMEGKVLKAGGVITDGPFVEIREMSARKMVAGMVRDGQMRSFPFCPVLPIMKFSVLLYWQLPLYLFLKRQLMKKNNSFA